MSLGRVSPVLAIFVACACGACSTAQVAAAPDGASTATDAALVDAIVRDATFADVRDESSNDDSGAIADDVLPDALLDAHGDAKPASEVGDASLDGDTATTPFVPPPGCASDAGASDATPPDIGEAGIGDSDISSTPVWRSVAKLNYGRDGHATFRIGDRLLVVGGSPGGYHPTPLPQEIYDPIADTWTVAGDPPAPTRPPNAAVLLADDRVLALVPEDVTTSPHIPRYARIFDSSFSLWTEIAPPSLCAPALIRLASGRVLGAGGACTPDDVVSTTTAEIYDPVADSWKSAAKMNVRRLAPQLLRLADDRVLAMGGDDSTGVGGGLSVEVYDPALDRWTLLPSSPFGPFLGAAGPLPSGKVLVALRLAAPPAGATDVPTPFSLFDPTCGSWTRAAWLPTAIDREALIVDRAGHVVTAGGGGLPYHMSTPSARATGAYDESLDRWTLLPPTERSWGHTLTLLKSGAIAMVGGNSGGKFWWGRHDTVSVLDGPP